MKTVRKRAVFLCGRVVTVMYAENRGIKGDENDWAEVVKALAGKARVEKVIQILVGLGLTKEEVRMGAYLMDNKLIKKYIDLQEIFVDYEGLERASKEAKLDFDMGRQAWI